MKKIIGALALLGIVGAGLTGCTGGSSPSSTAGGGHRTLTVLTYQTLPNPTYTAYFKECKKETGYTFKQVNVPQTQLINKAVQLTSSGDAPAMIVADNNNVATLADAGVLAPISLGKLNPKDFVQGPLQAGQYKGKQYGLPVGNNGEVIVYNKAMLSAAGISAPKSWDELTAAAKTLTTNGRYGFAQTFAPGETMSWNYWTQLWSNGGSIKHLSAKPAVEAAAFWSSFIKDGTAPQASLQWQATDIAAQLTKGQIAMGQVGTWTLPSLEDAAKKASMDIGITAQVTPHGEKPIIPFGGEELTMGTGLSSDEAKAVNDCIVSWSSDKAKLATRDEALGYLPSYIPAQAAVLKVSPDLQVLADMLTNSRSRTAEVGPDYPAYSTAVSTALQKIATGSATAQEAMNEAASSVKK